MADLVARLVAALGDRPAVRAAAQDVLLRYAEPQRAYHTAEHLAEMFAALDRLTDEVPPAVVCAVLWHDAVYDPEEADNEERSAELARSALAKLGADAWLIEETVRLVRLTAAHKPEPGDTVGELLSDADLAVLAAGPGRYARYTQQVRAEYQHVDNTGWRVGRAAVLRGLLEGGLYRTPVAQEWEELARRNLRDELRSLASA